MKILMIDNNSSGSPLRKLIKRSTRVRWDKNFCYVHTRCSDEAKEIVSERKQKGITYCGVLSGDGGIWNLINVLLPGEATMIIEPDGTSNNLGNSLREECEEFYQELFNQHKKEDINLADYEIEADVMEVREGDKKPEYAATTTSLGLTAAVCHEAETYRANNLTLRKIHYGTKLLKKKKELKPFKVSYSINKGKKGGTLENILAIEIANGPHIASMPNFNPEDTLRSGYLGCFFIEERGMRKFIELMVNLKLIGNIKHITSEKDERGFNKYGLNYNKIESLDLRVLDSENEEHYLEMDGEPRSFDPSQTIRVEVKPKAIKYIYLPWILRRSGKNTRKYYDENSRSPIS